MRKRARHFWGKQIIKKYGDLFIACAFITVLILFSRSPAEAVRGSLELCYHTLIPAVFPFMVISGFMIRTGTHKALSVLLGKPIKAIFGCSESASVSVILGFLSGFPIGALSAVNLYDNGEISKKELERILTFVNNPGAAFVIGGVGISIFASAQIGRMLYLSVIISSVLAGIVSRFLLKEDSTAVLRESPPKSNSVSVASAFTSALSDSALNMLTVCACVVFFSVPAGMISELLTRIGFPSASMALLSSFFEISGGCASSGRLASPLGALMTCAFACSWSGLSVHLQVFSVCRGRKISFAPYVTSKLLQGLFSPIFVFILSKFLSEPTFADKNAVISASPITQKVFSILFLISLVFLLTKGRKRSYNRNERRCIH
jgi:sporulation integral membrane protein YlbJ